MDLHVWISLGGRAGGMQGLIVCHGVVRWYEAHNHVCAVVRGVDRVCVLHICNGAHVCPGEACLVVRVSAYGEGSTHHSFPTSLPSPVPPLCKLLNRNTVGTKPHTRDRRAEYRWMPRLSPEGGCLGAKGFK